MVKVSGINFSEVIDYAMDKFKKCTFCPCARQSYHIIDALMHDFNRVIKGDFGIKDKTIVTIPDLEKQIIFGKITADGLKNTLKTVCNMFIPVECKRLPSINAADVAYFKAAMTAKTKDKVINTRRESDMFNAVCDIINTKAYKVVCKNASDKEKKAK